MSHHLCIHLFRNPSYTRRHVFLYCQRFRQISLDTRLWDFKQNKSHVLHQVLNKSWSRSYCHQDPKMLWKHKALQKYMEGLNEEYQTLDGCLQDISGNEDSRRALCRRHAKLAPLAAIYQEIQEAEQAIEELESMCKTLHKQDEKQLQELVSEERQIIDQKINTLYSELLEQLVPKEKYDKSDVILEVTSGRTTGGDICQQFTREIFDMYQNYSYYKHWKFELLNYTPADYGGLHHAAARISGDSVYKHLKYEGGIHRVQRIPDVGLSSRMQRIHTGTMSVIVLLQPDEVDVKVDPRDLRIDTFRSRGPGGQHVNTTDSAVRLVHIPTVLPLKDAGGKHICAGKVLGYDAQWCSTSSAPWSSKGNRYSLDMPLLWILSRLGDELLVPGRLCCPEYWPLGHLDKLTSARFNPRTPEAEADWVQDQPELLRLVVECQQERSQLKNKEIALRVLRARLYQQILEKDKCQQQSARKLQVGTRAQSERIRTYNFTQDRVTDHRIAFEVRDIKEFLRGEKCLDQLIQRLLQSADEEAIAEFLDESLKSVK